MRKYSILAPIAFLAPLGLPGQNLSIGIIGGGSLTGAVHDTTSHSIRSWSPSKDWMAGATLEFRLHSRLSMEVDGIYRELHSTVAFIEPDGTLNSVSPSPVVTWEFPVLAKYRFGDGKLRPFVEAGPSLRTTGNLNFSPSHQGLSAGLGLEARWRGLNIAPVIRYTHWAEDPHRVTPGESVLDQVELMVGVSRGAESRASPLGQRISVGAIGGWGLTNDISASTQNNSVVVVGQGNTFTEEPATEYVTGVKSLIAGPALEIHLPRHFSVEVDALYKQLRDHYATVLGSGTVYSSATDNEASTWQFPVLGKYRFHRRGVHPFVEAGPSFRLPEESLATYGITAGAGVEIHWRAIHLAPAFRFTRWGDEDLNRARNYLRNEAAVLVGVSFGGPTEGTR